MDSKDQPSDKRPKPLVDIKDILTLDAAVITGLLFFFALSADLPERVFIVAMIIFPLEMFSISVIAILVGTYIEHDQTKLLKKGLRISTLSIAVLFVALLVIGFDVITGSSLSRGFEKKIHRISSHTDRRIKRSLTH